MVFLGIFWGQASVEHILDTSDEWEAEDWRNLCRWSAIGCDVDLSASSVKKHVGAKNNNNWD